MGEEFFEALAAGGEGVEAGVAEGEHHAAGAEGSHRRDEELTLELLGERGPGEAAEDDVDAVGGGDALEAEEARQVDDRGVVDVELGVALLEEAGEGFGELDCEVLGALGEGGGDVAAEGAGAGAVLDDGASVLDAAGADHARGEVFRGRKHRSDLHGVLDVRGEEAAL